jgi:hypothetical protein
MGDYWMEFRTKTSPLCASHPFLSSHFFLSLFSQPTFEIHFFWSRNSVPSSSFSSPSQIISRWIQFFMTIFAFAICLLLNSIPFNSQQKSTLAFRLMIDLKVSGILHLSLHELSWNHINLIAEIDCELLVTICHVIIQWDLSEIIQLLLHDLRSSISPLTHPSSSSPFLSFFKSQTSILFSLNHWQTTSLNQIKLTPYERKFIESFFEDSCYQYFHPQINFFLSLSWNPSEKWGWKWEDHQSNDSILLNEHLSILFSILKKNTNVFPSKSTLSSPSLHLFLTSLFNSLEQPLRHKEDILTPHQEVS